MTCDLCRKPLLVEEEVRYLVKIEVKAAYDPMEITDEDLARDLAGEIRETARRLQGMGAEEAMDQVYRVFRFDLCPPCQRDYLKDPLGAGGPA